MAEKLLTHGRRERRIGWVILLVTLGALAAVPFLGPSSGQFGSLNFEYVLTIALVAIGMNVVVGYAGQLTLGPGAVFGAGAYAAALVNEHYNGAADLPVMIVAGMVAGILVGLIVGGPSLRIGGFYLGNTTLLFALALPAIAQNTASLGGAYGFSTVGSAQYPSGTWLYELVLVFVVLFILLQAAVRYSRVGRRLLCIGSSAELGSSVGMSPYRTKLLALVVSSVPAGIAGALYLYGQQLVTPDSVSANLSFYILAAIVLGGFGTLLGPVVGTLIVVGASIFFAQEGTATDIGFGLLLIVLALAAPGGLDQLGKKALALVGSRGSVTEAEVEGKEASGVRLPGGGASGRGSSNKADGESPTNGGPEAPDARAGN